MVDEPADQVLARTVPVDREHSRTRGLAIVRDEQVRGDRHVALGVEHDRLPAVRPAIFGAADLQLEAGHAQANDREARSIVRGIGRAIRTIASVPAAGERVTCSVSPRRTIHEYQGEKLRRTSKAGAASAIRFNPTREAPNC